ncbi:VQ motif-containing protein 25 [Hibiscus syriacus]|uniref:VQ motif-containing protein 25 n=1 Tax=Hibiscus syriacus TaxID=106335 RepID=A0A6A2ZD95_HIBSY|nr:VQ motif-containing protein 25 [Hibiscus syriacus]
MENLMMMKNQTRMSPPTPSSLSIHKDSQTISKAKPKIRIIHIFAPEIIKTDVANFRELVQRLTGKPPQCKKKPKKGDKPVAAEKMEARIAGSETAGRVKRKSASAKQRNSSLVENELDDGLQDDDMRSKRPKRPKKSVNENLAPAVTAASASGQAQHRPGNEFGSGGFGTEMEHNMGA